MNGVRSFSGLHFVHLFVLDEEVVPVVPEDVKQVIGYCSSDGQFRIVLYSLMGQKELLILLPSHRNFSKPCIKALP